jgi:hypothetical protein
MEREQLRLSCCRLLIPRQSCQQLCFPLVGRTGLAGRGKQQRLTQGLDPGEQGLVSFLCLSPGGQQRARPLERRCRRGKVVYVLQNCARHHDLAV